MMALLNNKMMCFWLCVTVLAGLMIVVDLWPVWAITSIFFATMLGRMWRSWEIRLEKSEPKE